MPQTFGQFSAGPDGRFVSGAPRPKFRLLAAFGFKDPNGRVWEVPAGVEVVSAFQNVSAHRLQHLPDPVECDVVVSGAKEARARVSALCALVPGLRALDGGPLANARYVEAWTALLIGLNVRYKVPEGLGFRITGLPEGAGPGAR